MKRILAPILLLVLLFPTLALGEEVTLDDLVQRDGLRYKKFNDVPFTGKVTGEWQGSFRNGIEEGPWVIFHKNGQLAEKGTYKNGWREGPWIGYYENGQLSFKGTYKDRNKHGPFAMFYENGQLFQKGTYKDYERVGPWVGYKRDGTVDEEITGTYENGEKVK